MKGEKWIFSQNDLSSDNGHWSSPQVHVRETLVREEFPGERMGGKTQ